LDVSGWKFRPNGYIFNALVDIAADVSLAQPSLTGGCQRVYVGRAQSTVQVTALQCNFCGLTDDYALPLIAIICVRSPGGTRILRAVSSV
jgi:hypothetical protein